MNVGDALYRRYSQLKFLAALLTCLFAVGCNTDEVDRNAIVVSYNMVTGQNNWTAHPEVPRLTTPRYIGKQLHFLAIDECKECDDGFCWQQSDSDLFNTQPIAFDMTSGAMLSGSVNIGHAIANTDEIIIVDESFKSSNHFSEEKVLSGISSQNEAIRWSVVASAISVQVIITAELTFIVEPLTTRLFAMNNTDGNTVWQIEWQRDETTEWFLHYIGGAEGETSVMHFALEKRSLLEEQEDVSLLAINRNSGEIVASFPGTMGEFAGSTGDAVVRQTDTHWVGVDGVTGAQKWQQARTGNAAIWHAPGTKLFFISSPVQLSAISADTGETVWTMAHSDTAIIAWSKTKIATLDEAQETLSLYNIADGQLQWQSHVPSGIHKIKLALNDNFITVFGQDYQPAKACGNPF